jgi:hypothetical protein
MGYMVPPAGAHPGQRPMSKQARIELIPVSTWSGGGRFITQRHPPLHTTRPFILDVREHGAMDRLWLRLILACRAAIHLIRRA